MSIRAEAIAAEALKAWLLEQLPAVAATINTSRTAWLRSSFDGTYSIPASAVFPVSTLSRATSDMQLVPLTEGARTAQEIADEINTYVNEAWASADTQGRLVLRSPYEPTTSAMSLVAVGPDSTGANAALGFDPGGSYDVRTPVIAPSSSGVMDGWPLTVDASALSGMVVIIGDRESKPLTPFRKNERLVTLDLAVLRMETQGNVHQRRDGIGAAMQAVRECLSTVAGRQLGRASQGDIVFCEETSAKISGQPFQLKVQGASNALMDMASIKLSVRVFERPSDE